jgi:hypothetical protein
MKLTERQMIEIIDKKLINQCSEDEQEQVMNFAFGEDFLRGKARERVDAIRAKEIHRRKK